jgi:hypothetical protein
MAARGDVNDAPHRLVDLVAHAGVVDQRIEDIEKVLLDLEDRRLATYSAKVGGLFSPLICMYAASWAASVDRKSFVQKAWKAAMSSGQRSNRDRMNRVHAERRWLSHRARFAAGF